MTESFHFATGLGTITFAPFNPDTDHLLIQPWVSQAYAAYWGMQNQTAAEVQANYRALLDKPKVGVFLGLIDGTPKFLIERYAVETDPIAAC
ncbi:GNAT family N-acetyltransferase, partial [Halorubrum tibetense]